jgi:acetyl-CoA acetyltransferase
MAYREINEAWIVGAVRTPIRRHGGTLSSVRSDDLGALVFEALVERTGVPPQVERLNPIALGHPLGCSGARILTTLVHEMGRRSEVRYGLTTMCVGVGQGIVMVVESGSQP